MDKIELMRAFESVARHSSFTNAAKEMDVSFADRQ